MNLAAIRRRHESGCTTDRDVSRLIDEVKRLRRALREQLSDPGTHHVKQRRGAHDTEIDAAHLALPRSGTQRMKVLDYIIECGRNGATDEEIQRDLAMHPNSETPRRLELVELGWIRDSGKRRETGTGSEAIVWRLTPAAREYMRRNR